MLHKKNWLILNLGNIHMVYFFYNYNVVFYVLFLMFYFLFYRMKDLESKLAERDAMIRVLQKHTYDKDSSSSSGVGSYPAAHSSHSSTSADHHTALTSTPELGKKCIFMKK